MLVQVKDGCSFETEGILYIISIYGDVWKSQIRYNTGHIVSFTETPEELFELIKSCIKESNNG